MKRDLQKAIDGYLKECMAGEQKVRYAQKDHVYPPLLIRFANMSRSKVFQPNYDCIREVFERSTNGAKQARSHHYAAEYQSSSHASLGQTIGNEETKRVFNELKLMPTSSNKLDKSNVMEWYEEVAAGF